jgi:transposase
MIKAPTPEEEDRRRICRERKTLTAERIQQINQIRGFVCRGNLRLRPVEA